MNAKILSPSALKRKTSFKNYLSQPQYERVSIVPPPPHIIHAMEKKLVAFEILLLQQTMLHLLIKLV